MKKTFVTVTLFVVMAVAANATGRQQDNAAGATQAEVINPQDDADDEDIYRTYVLNSSENDKHIIRFYDIDRIVIENKHHAVIRIYDSNWKLIEKTRDDVDKEVRAGNYYVTCSTKITGRYMQ